MSTNTPTQAWKVRSIVASAAILAVAGGLWVFSTPEDDKPPATTIAATCGEFEVNAFRLFDQGDTATLKGSFAPGDHLHLAIDFNGASYSWKSTGVLGMMPEASRSGVIGWYKFTGDSKATYTPEQTLQSASANSKISGFARLEVEIDVTTIEDGEITIKKTGHGGLAPRVAIASCKPAKQTPTTTRQLSS